MDKFLGEFRSKVNQLFDDLRTRYPKDEDGINFIRDQYSFIFKGDDIHHHFNAFMQERTDIEDEFNAANEFRTSVRGIKVRGVYDTLREAQVRSEVLKRVDDKHNIYIAQVGCWCPWSPDPNQVQDQEFAETQLNTLMREYRNNQTKKDIFYEERKEELRRLAMRQNKVKQEQGNVEESTPQPTDAGSSNVTTTEAIPQNTLEAADPWLQRKQASTDETSSNTDSA